MTSAKSLISFLIILFSFSTQAGGGGGGGVLNSLSPEAKSELSFAGGSGGGGGVHPSRVQPTDYVRMQTVTNERIIRFQYKPAESNTIQSYSVPVESVRQQYLDALEKSAATNNWESIEVR